MPAPLAVIIAGPNGSGKSTTAEGLLPSTIQFVNADMIAQELSGERSTPSDLKAGRLLVHQLDMLEADRRDFAVETTLANKKLIPRIARLQEVGYETHLIFMWLQSPELAVGRVAQRVRMGGHQVPEETVRRRYAGGLRHFFRIYQPLVDQWWLYDNSRLNDPRRIATGGRNEELEITDEAIWNQLVQEWS